MESDQNLSSDEFGSELRQQSVENRINTQHVQIVSGNTLTLSRLEDAIPFFLEPDNTVDVAEEVEVETSSVGGGCGNVEVMSFDCDVDLTLSPDPPEAIEQVAEQGDESEAEMGNEFSAGEGNECLETSPFREDEGSGEGGYCGPPLEIEEEDNGGSDEEASELECQRSKPGKESQEEEAHMDNGYSDTQSADEGNYAEEANGCDLEKDNESKERMFKLPSRDSCIKWAVKPKMSVGNQDNVLREFSRIKMNANCEKKTAHTSTSRITPVLRKGEVTNSQTVSGIRTLCMPEVTPRVDDVMILPACEPLAMCQPIIQCPQQFCCHASCLVNEFWTCLPFWISYAQVHSCIESCSTIKTPPGFEDPPESEWVLANVYQVDPSDGTLRYKCRNCEGIVEQRSTKQKFQLNYSNLKYACELCHRRYLTRKQLKLHSIRHNVKTRVCLFCDKRFLTQSELQNHVNTHTRQRPFQCQICRQRFAHSSRYYAHIRNIHKKYDCNECYSQMCLSSSRQCK